MKWVVVVLGVLVILALAAIAAVPYLVNLPRVQIYVAQEASRTLGRPVEFSDLSVSVLPLPAIVLKDLRVAEDPKFGRTPFLSVDQGRFTLRLAPLLRRRFEFGELMLERPQMALIQDSAGRWNVASLGAHALGSASGSPKPAPGPEAPTPLPVVSRLRIVDGSVDYRIHPRRESAASYRLDRIELTLEGLATERRLAVRGTSEVNPGAISVRLDGALGPLAGASSWAAAPVTGTVSLEARELAALTRVLWGPARSLSGLVAGKLSLTGTLDRLGMTGQLEATRLTLAERRPGCPPPETRNLILESLRFPLTYEPSALTGRPLSARLADGSVSLTLRLSWNPAPLLSLKEISVKALPLEPVLVGYLCQGYAVTGPLDLVGELSTRPGRFLGTLGGQGQMKIGPGEVVGPAALSLFGSVVRVGGALSSVLNLDLPLSLFSSPMKFESITATYRIVNGRVRTEDLLYTSKRMTVAGAGEYQLVTDRVSFDLTMKHGRGQIKAKVTGSAASPSVRVVPATILRTEPKAVPSRLQKFLEELTK